jgi:hypothetical protein
VAGNSLLPSDWNSPGTSCFHWNGNGNLIRNISLPSHSLGHKRTNFIISIKHFLGWNLRNFLPKSLVKIKCYEILTLKLHIIMGCLNYKGLLLMQGSL